MLDFIWQSILYLNEPIHVANIQKFFGLERIEPAKNSAQHQHTPNNVNISFLHNVIAANLVTFSTVTASGILHIQQ